MSDKPGSTPSSESRRTPSCPVCGKPAHKDHAPFCSATCRDRDLLAWLDGRYVMPGPPANSDAEDG